MTEPDSTSAVAIRLQACTFTNQFFGYSFVDRDLVRPILHERDRSRLGVSAGDTIVRARVKDIRGNFGEPREIVVRISGVSTATPTPTATPLPPTPTSTRRRPIRHAATLPATRTVTRTRTATRTRTPVHPARPPSRRPRTAAPPTPTTSAGVPATATATAW